MENNTNGRISLFISKLYTILKESKNSYIVTWNKEGNAFQIINLNLFCTEILPLHFNITLYSSFVRQLNIYDFHKIKSVHNIHGYEHILFKQDKPQLLYLIKRKRNSLNTNSLNHLDKPTSKNLKIDLKDIKTKLSDLCTKLTALQMRIKISEGKQEFLDYCHSDLSQRNHKIQMELYSLSEKERNLEDLFYYVIRTFFPKIKIVDNPLQNLPLQFVEKKNDIINHIFKKIQYCHLINNFTPHFSGNNSELGDKYVKILNMIKASDTQRNFDAKNEISYYNQIKELQKIYLSTIDESSSYFYNINSNGHMVKQNTETTSNNCINSLIEQKEANPFYSFLQFKTLRNTKE